MWQRYSALPPVLKRFRIGCLMATTLGSAPLADVNMPPSSNSSRSVLVALIACQIGLHACVQGVRLAAPLSALRQGYSEWSVGLVLTMFALFPALLAIPAGRFADRNGYHLPVRLAAILSVVGAFLAVFSEQLVFLCASAALCGAGSGLGMITIQRSASRLSHGDADSLRVFSWIALAPAIAGLFGPMLAGALIDYAGFTAAFVALALLPACTLLISKAVPVERLPTTVRGLQNQPSSSGLLRLPAFRRLLLINWLVSASWDVHCFALPILGVQRGLSASALGGVLAAYAVSSMAVRLIIPVVAELLPRRHILVGALMLTFSVFLVYPLLYEAWAMALCAAALGIALGAIQPSILATLLDVVPKERHGEALAFRSMTVHASMTVMPLFFGLIGAGIGAASLFWLMATALGLGCLEARQLRSVGRC